MAIQITKTFETCDGFEVSGLFTFLEVFLTSNRPSANLSYYKSEDAWKAGKGGLCVTARLPFRVDLEISATDFWGTELATKIHNQCIVEIEKIIGAGTCAIVSLEAPVTK
jgi:hypothetical protein